MNLTVGPHPSAVYWRRRALVAAPLLIILVTFTTCLATGSDGSTPKPKAAADNNATSPTPTPTPSATVTPSTAPAPDWSSSPTPPVIPPPTPTPTGPLACADKDLALVALVEKDTYRVGRQPRFKLSVTNSSTRPCLRDVGSGQQELWVTSGVKKLWSSDHCSPNKGSDSRTIYAGEKLTYWLTWSARTSDVGCPKAHSDVGAGTYQLTARLGTLVSKPVPFTITS
jgi:hypothetical protein